MSLLSLQSIGRPFPLKVIVSNAYNILYQNDCSNASGLTSIVTNVGGTITSDGNIYTLALPGSTGYVYGTINTGLNLINKTVKIDYYYSGGYLMFAFGCDNLGNGYRIYITNAFPLLYYKTGNVWQQAGSQVAGLLGTTGTVTSNKWYTITISITSLSDIRWNLSEQGSTTYVVAGVSYYRYTSNPKVSASNTFIGLIFNSSASARVDNIKIYDGVMLV